MMLLQILPASSSIIIHKYAGSESSDTPSYLSPLVSGAGPLLTVPVSHTSVSTLSSPDDSMQGVTGDSEQPDYPVRPVTPGEEELMRIHEDGGYCPPDMIEIPGGFQIGRYRIRPETPERLSSMVCRSSC